MSAATSARVPRLAVWKFTSCDGCQLTLLDCEDELLALAGRVEIAQFREATSTEAGGEYDVSVVEGSITTPEEMEAIRHIRAVSRTVVAIGACATAGGIQALRNGADLDEFIAAVYARPEHIRSLEHSTPHSAHISVDFELRGCPIDRGQLLEVLTALLAGRRPRIPGHSVCVQCKRRGIPCVMVAHGTPCLGPVTQAGCGALCTAFGRGCYGCFGPADTTNTASLSADLHGKGMTPRDLSRLLRTFNADAPAFRAAAEAARGLETAP